MVLDIPHNYIVTGPSAQGQSNTCTQGGLHRMEAFCTVPLLPNF